MIGYHYTTQEAYEQICVQGLQLSPLEERHRKGCALVLHLIPQGCIWIYPEFMRERKLMGMLFYVAARHDSNNLVCLEVEYPEVHSATWMAELELRSKKGYEDDSILLRHNLGIDFLDRSLPFGHDNQIFDLVTQPILSKDIYLAGAWDLMEFVRTGIIGTREYAEFAA